MRVCAELLPAVVRAAPLFRGNLGAATDPRIEIRVRDGRRELLRSPERYDVITLEPPPPSAAGVVNLYSSDFYALAGTRDQPRIEYATWVRPGEITRVLPRLLALRTEPPLSGADGAFQAAVAGERDRFLRFYAAGLHAYDRDTALWARDARNLMGEVGRNPYYAWFLGGAR